MFTKNLIYKYFKSCSRININILFFFAFASIYHKSIIFKSVKTMSWSDASENFKKILKNRLGDIAYREFLRNVTNDCSLDVINDWWRWSMLTKDKDIHQELFRMVSDYDPVTWSDEPRSTKATTETEATTEAETETETETETPAFVDDNQLYYAQELAGIYDDGFSFNYDNPTADLSGKENLYPLVNESIITSNDSCAPPRKLFCEQGLSCPQSLSCINLQITHTPLPTLSHSPTPSPTLI